MSERKSIQEEATDSPNEDRLLRAIPALAPIFAPVTVTLTAMLYLAGYISRAITLEMFGLSIGMFENTIQGTLAEGYVPVAMGTFVAGIFLSFFWFFIKGARRPNPNTGAEWVDRVGQWLDKIIVINGLVLMALILLSYGAFAAIVTGKITAFDIAESVEGGCARGCAEYKLKDRSFVGKLIVQSEKFTAIYTEQGTVVFSSDKLVLVLPRRKISEEGPLDFLKS